MQSKLPTIIRDLFFAGIALAILYQEVFVAKTAQPILIFLVIFLLGAIPALRSDAKPGHYGPFARVVMLMLGIEVPPHWTEAEEAEEEESTIDSRPRPRKGQPPSEPFSSDTPTSSE